MYHGILLKVHGDNKEHAQEQADDIMQSTMRCPECEASRNNINWDYFHFVAVVDSAWIKKNRSDRKGVKTVEDLVQHYILLRKQEEKRYTKKVVEALDEYKKAYDKNKELPDYSMLNYYMGELEAIKNVIRFGDADNGLYTLHCLNNHYADMTRNTEGKKSFYFWYDRHH